MSITFKVGDIVHRSVEKQDSWWNATCAVNGKDAKGAFTISHSQARCAGFIKLDGMIKKRSCDPLSEFSPEFNPKSFQLIAKAPEDVKAGSQVVLIGDTNGVDNFKEACIRNQRKTTEVFIVSSVLSVHFVNDTVKLAGLGDKTFPRSRFALFHAPISSDVKEMMGVGEALSSVSIPAGLQSPHTAECAWIKDTRKRCDCGKPNAPTGTYTGGSVDYYKVLVKSPTTPYSLPYTAECNDIIESLGMNYAEGNAFKALWRRAAQRTLGLRKAGSKDDGLYDAEKVEFFGKRLVEQSKGHE